MEDFKFNFKVYMDIVHVLDIYTYIYTCQSHNQIYTIVLTFIFDLDWLYGCCE